MSTWWFLWGTIFGVFNLGKDKNPDDPLAASRFIQITKAYQALTEPWIDVFCFFALQMDDANKLRDEMHVFL